MALLNLGIVAHVDAGKTSLTERLLYEAGAVSQPGSVDAGTTRTDSMELERRRGITIRAAVTSIAIGDLTINLLDTPGHPDFIAEVERSLAVLDAAVLVLSSVEGVQPQTVAIWRALRRIGVPTVLFLNKVDRRGADVDRVTTQVRQRLGARPVILTAVTGQGGPDARVRAVGLDTEPVVEAVAEVDDAVAARWLTDEPVRVRDVRRAIRNAVRRAELTPVACGSAITGAGVRQLCHLLAQLLPRGPERDGPLTGTVFAVDRDGHGRRAWLRVWSGSLRVRDRVRLGGPRPQTVTQIAVIEPAGVLVRPSVAAGQIAAVRGLSARIGQHIGDPPRRHVYRFPPPTRQALVEPVDPDQRLAMFAGLAELADEDPLVDLRLDEQQAQAVIRLHGEVQKEVLAALMADRYGVRVRFSGTLTACIERVAGTGAAEERVHERGNPYLAGLGLRIAAAPVGHGIDFRPGVEPGRLPPAFVAATEEGVRAALRQGPHGWPVTDCTVTMTSSQYWPRQSRPHQKFDKSISTVAADFRNLAPVVVAAALRRAGTRVCQPIERFEVNLPQHTVETVLALLGRLGAVVHDTAAAGGYLEVGGTLPSSRVPQLVAALPDLTGGEAVLTTDFDHYASVAGADPPTVYRRGPDPADREAWFRAVPR
ncbi:TetM/TetW/TetO/TetS family tetracycline resistance ribosomal protection protein [Micromonospora sp. PPF5-17]|uniref:GTP-binding protein n=1 Tax=Micromonospora solifontis TaxID=2487138 RepID=A0ABX9WH11_9ACTN|nr:MULTISPECIES: TetM/TetW/TetO/TetS family tetracycline resistance ribosomal protection protein [Micromonospora]NES37408.1 TetM/TetW/TetO/TetS family tetracycline resistance ribosomal protection protein [Micromonospora solifontis]NES58047.1 TetM/TetW/TetO/TetS family tetracycline resistance ribosomal protection protein [Micromonospora sp. PPF5-6]RNL98413.1 GTP-binding protein [Micromonospora solifontis]